MKILRRSGVAGLEPERRRRLALDAPSPPAQREALAAALRRGHCDLLPDDAIAAMVDVQRARDAQLARALVDAATRDGAVLIAGAQHVRRDVGVPFWLARLEPGASVVSVALRELPDGVTVARRVEPSEPARHDFVVWTGRIDRGDPCERLRGDP